MANPEHLDMLKQGVAYWNEWRAKNPTVQPDLKRAFLTEIDLSKANLSDTYLNEANLRHAHMREVYLVGADLAKADLHGAVLNYANLTWANLFEANLAKAVLVGANLSWANLRRAELREVDLVGANLSGTNLSEANLNNANLNNAILVRTNMQGANLTACSIYGISTWDAQLAGAIQSNLIITLPGAPTITVDNLEVAQFIYLLLNNTKIRDVIDTIAKKAVLILGRFSPEREAVLDALKDALRTKGYLPILFDFDKPSSQDLTETVSTLAHLSRFIVADLTDPSCIPHELYAIVPHRKVPVQSIFCESQEAKHEYSMFQDLRKKYHWVLPTHRYRGIDDLLASLQERVIEPAEQKAQELVKL